MRMRNVNNHSTFPPDQLSHPSGHLQLPSPEKATKGQIMKQVFSFLAVLIIICGTTSQAADTPNIIYILADDLGWTDLGCQGSKYYESPNIDPLAAQGMRLTRYHNCQNCQPTRAALMTGQYAPRTGVYPVGGIDRFDWQSRPLRPVDNVAELPLEKITIAQT